MRTLFLTFVLLLSSVVSAQEARPISASEAQQVTAAIEAFLYGASINDAQAHDKFWAPELTYTSSNGTRFGKAELMQGLMGSEALSDGEVSAWYTAENIELKSFGTAVIVNFTLVSTQVLDQSRETFLNSGVLVPRRDGWQAVNWHATRAAPATQP
ncbi:nuclear transport factor 2 family protein [Pseudidiomarina sp. 1APP75-32.1]|uniref:Nuclear transport factor 2 family protein n=1 Tax=Pseudidiomarina terrestris TaxID=2820060 RepID=A0AAW7QXL5_9GAMM|nr:MULTISPECIES: DUF4440 domain-containing protein [unclassified Pseudidiomarina]MDN7124912.1 nuclear transport factor 2 family protein [Pseudidiomarina sp. 1APP75-32.1]MDN7129615.1 nuclear transport factor 2 family protein [Pseudidiomarina sp. 1APR75-15]